MPSDDQRPARPPRGALPASLHMAVHDSLESVEVRWRDAWTRLAGTPFQNFDWVRAWHENLGKRYGWKVCIAELRADTPDGRTVLLLPLGIRREGLLRVMGFLGADLVDYQAPLIDAEFARSLTPAHAARLWNGFVAILPSVDMIRLRRLPERIGTLANPFAALPGARLTEQAHAVRLPADFKQFTAAREARLFADSRRQLRRLAELGKVRIATRVVDPAERLRVMDALASQKSRRWIQTGAWDAFGLPGFREFFDVLARGELDGVESVMSALMLDDRIIATHWGMRMCDRYYWLMPTYDPEWARFSPGRLLMEAVLRACIEDRLSVFDLTAGDEPYKRQWADESMGLYALRQSCSTLGAWAVNLGRVREFARRQPALRNVVQKLRGKR